MRAQTAVAARPVLSRICSRDNNARYTLDGVGLPGAEDTTGPTISSISFGIVKNFSGKFM
jgi:hypothetical protein